MIKPVEPKKILCIHDLSGVGRCSLAVILPVLSVMGLQPVALPTVVLSTHTGGLGTPARLDGLAVGTAVQTGRLCLRRGRSGALSCTGPGF